MQLKTIMETSKAVAFKALQNTFHGCLTKEETNAPVNGTPLLLNFLYGRQGRKKEEPGKVFGYLFFNCFINLMFCKLRLVRFDSYLIFLG